MTHAPPANAQSHSSLRTALAASCRAVSEDAHAASTHMDGPIRPRLCEIRPAAPNCPRLAIRCPL